MERAGAPCAWFLPSHEASSTSHRSQSGPSLFRHGGGGRPPRQRRHSLLGVDVSGAVLPHRQPPWRVAWIPACAGMTVRFSDMGGESRRSTMVERAESRPSRRGALRPGFCLPTKRHRRHIAVSRPHPFSSWRRRPPSTPVSCTYSWGVGVSGASPSPTSAVASCGDPGLRRDDVHTASAQACRS